MAVTPGTRTRHGKDMRRRRKAKGLTLRDVSALLAEHGDSVTEASLSGYERGEYAPSHERALLLDAVLEAGGELVSILGFTPEEPIDTFAQSGLLQEQINDLRAQIAELREAVQKPQ